MKDTLEGSNNKNHERAKSFQFRGTAVFLQDLLLRAQSLTAFANSQILSPPRDTPEVQKNKRSHIRTPSASSVSFNRNKHSQIRTRSPGHLRGGPTRRGGRVVQIRVGLELTNRH